MKLKLAGGLWFLGMLAGCETSAPQQGVMDDGSNPEQTCAGALAEEANVDMSGIRSTGVTEIPGGGYDVTLSLNGAPWLCQIAPDGTTELTFQGEG